MQRHVQELKGIAIISTAVAVLLTVIVFAQSGQAACGDLKYLCTAVFAPATAVILAVLLYLGLLVATGFLREKLTDHDRTSKF